MALVAMTNGTTYRLRQAVFQIDGPDRVALDSDAQPDAAVLTASLTAGSYTATLAPGWFLERLSAGGGATRVQATLTSPNPVPFTITANTTTGVPFTFNTDGTVVTVDQGSVAISVDVTENGGAGQVTLLAGNIGGRGSGDGVGQNARLNFPLGVATDGAGHLFIADNSNNEIRQVELATGQVTTLAGHTGFPVTLVDGQGASASFASPQGLASDGAGNLYVADNGNRVVRKIVIATGDVTTFVAGFDNVVDVTSDGAGNLYVVDGNQAIVVQVDLDTRSATTLAGGGPPDADGVGTAAGFSRPNGIAADGMGNLYVSDAGNATIRKIVIATGEVTTLAGSPGGFGSADGTGAAASFSSPGGLTIDGAGDLFVADVFNVTIRQVVLATGEVTTVAGSAGLRGSIDGTGSAARFDFPQAVVSDGAGNLYVADSDNSLLRKVVAATGQVTTVVGRVATFGSRDARGTAALFGSVEDTFSDGAGNLYVCDNANNTIRKVVVATGEVTTIAGTAGLSGSNDGVGAAARFDGPDGVTGDGAGNLYVSDSRSSTIRKLDLATGAVTTIAGTAGVSGSVDGFGSAAQFDFPRGLAADGAGNLFVVDARNATIRKVVIATGLVTTFAGFPHAFGNADGFGTAASFSDPRSIASDGAAGNLYVVEDFTSTIRKIFIPTAQVTTLAGSPNVVGSSDGTGSAARFNFPIDIASDGAGNLYVGDDGNHTIRKIVAATGEVTTVAGVPGVSGVVLGALPARLNFPGSLSVLPDGGLAFGDEGAVLVARF
jgi:sugar lactone lactonase YvrE